MLNEIATSGTTLLRRARKGRKIPPGRQHALIKKTLRCIPDTPPFRKLCGSQAAFFHTLDELREFATSIRAMGSITEWLDKLDKVLWEFDDLFDEFSQGKILIRDLAERWVDEISHSLEELLDNAPSFEVPSEFDNPWANNLVDDLTILTDVKCEKVKIVGYEFYGAILQY